jgi:hypothetical protein
MRRLTILTCVAFLVATPFAAHAQHGGGAGGQQDKQAEEDAKKKKRDKEWGDSQAPLPALRNAGPCPYVKTLYDASRYVEFKNGHEASADVGFTGEIQNLSAGCQYKDDEPIKLTMDILFEFGKGPQAAGSSKTYRYWIAVTDRNRDVIAKQEFEVPVNFPSGKDRVFVTEPVNSITIPRGTATTSGANFEVLVGFDVTPQMADFNRQGKRFRVNAGETTVATGGVTQRR